MTQLKEDNINVISAETSTKLDIDGISKTYEVFKIKLNLLYYNDKNDRIGTWVSQYKAEHGDLDVTSENYNEIIHDFIKKSNPSAMDKTIKNIRAVNQRVPGVVLRDGRIIDGNRRFTSLRELSKEDPKFSYFEAVILDHDYTKDNTAIKELELKLQHGVDEKVDYDPIERLVGIYNDIVEGPLTIERYASCTNEKPKEVSKNVEIAKYMVEFLQFINAPKQFHIARNLDLNGPLHELYGAISKETDEDRKETIKKAFFANLIMRPSGDMTRYVRQIKNMMSDEEISQEYLDDQEDKISDLIDLIDEAVTDEQPLTQKVISEKIQSNEGLKDRLKISVENSYSKYTAKENKNEPLKLLKDANTKLDGVDINILKMLKDDKIEEVKNILNEIEGKISDIKERL